MRVIKKDAATGFLRIGIDSLDDLWTLRTLIRPGDLVTASTYRTAESADDKLRAEKVPKQRMTLGVRVESVEWHDFDDHLRVHGIIEDGPQDLGRHHTHIFRDEYGTELRLQKPGRLERWHTELVQQAIDNSQRPQVLLLAIDDSEAQFGQLQSYGLRMLGSLPAGGQGKRFDGKNAGRAKKDFYDEVVKSLRALRPDASIPLLVVGPGWWREEFLEHAQAKAPDVIEHARTDGVSQGGKGGLHEAMKRGLLAQVVRDHRVGLETTLVEEVFTRIATNAPVAYGAVEVEAAVAAGAAESILVTDQAVRDSKHDKMLRAAEQARSDVHVVSTSHDAGARLQAMGGVAALLRFALG